MSNHHITYLLGAGASANCLPVVTQMAERIEELLKDLAQIDFSKKLSGSKLHSEFSELLFNMKKDLLWLKSACKSHSSVDTYAKKLYIAGESSEYHRLKTIISVYFTLEQALRPLDLRYDNFWASILNKQNELPVNPKILSWNYDFQLELSYLNFTNGISLNSCRDMLKIPSIKTPKEGYPLPDEFCLFKINGSAGYEDTRDNIISYVADSVNFGEDREHVFYRQLFESYKYMRSEINQSLLSFAWEGNIKSNLFEQLYKCFSSTTVLVVIGYSFPFFNRQIDRFIINDCMQQLSKVYFQAPDAEDLKERFLAIRNDIPDKQLLIRKDLNQFVFPNEL